MQKVLVLTLCMFVLLVGNAFSQVIADFETDAGGFFDNGWGAGFNSVMQAADPSGLSSGVLALDYNSTAKGVIQVNNVDPLGAQIITYYVYLTADVPDSISFKLWAQDDGSWSWTQVVYYAYEIPRGVWYPLNYNMEAMRIDPAINFDHIANKIGKMGVEVANWYEHDADTSWTGLVYIDNVSLLGAEPTVFADFEDGTNDFFDNGWGPGLNSVSQAVDPTGESSGVLAVEFNSTGKGVIQKNNLTAAGNNVITYFVYLPADIPDSISFKLWAQDKNTWSWTEVVHYVYNMSKEVWYPIVYDMEAMRVDPNISFDHQNYEIGKMGIEIANWDEHDADTSWVGIVYIDNASFMGTETGKKWLLVDFENSDLGTAGFVDKNWGGAMDMAWAADPSGRSAGVLAATWTFTAAAADKDAMAYSGIDLKWTETDTGATAMSIDAWIPEDYPATGLILSVWSQTGSGWTWSEVAMVDSELVRGGWNTLVMDVVELAAGGSFDPLDVKTFGVQLQGQEDWSGNIYFDDFTLWDIEKPDAPLVTPLLAAVAEIDTTDVGIYDPVNHLEWTDGDENLQENYNIFASKSPIANLGDPGVIRIGAGVPRAVQEWFHRPYTETGAEETWYYAITAYGLDGEEKPITTAGPVTNNSSLAAKAVYDTDFGSKFTIDADLSEFNEYAEYKLSGDDISGDSTQVANWLAADPKLDIYWEANFVIDDNYLYFGAYVIDDDPTSLETQAWIGDALELYIGMYDTRGMDTLHTKGSIGVDNVPNRRISFHAKGTTQDGVNDVTYAGLEYLIEPGGVGYIIEAKFDLDSIAVDGFKVEHGVMMAMRMDNTDSDPTLNPAEAGTRTLILSWGGTSSNENWLRPSQWGGMMIFDPAFSSVDDETPNLPLTTQLYDNYPNPFNPTTTIKFDLAKASHVSIVVFNSIGQRVKTIFDGNKKAGKYDFVWDARNDHGNRVGTGVYFFKMTADDYQMTKKMVLIK